MTFPIFGSECAPGVLYTRPTVEPGAIQINAVAIDLVRPFGLDRLPSGSGSCAAGIVRSMGGSPAFGPGHSPYSAVPTIRRHLTRTEN